MIYNLKQILLPFENGYQNVIVDTSEGSKGLPALVNTLILSPTHKSFAKDLIDVLNDSVEVDSDLLVSHLINIAQFFNPQQNINSAFLRQSLNDFIDKKSNLDPVFNGGFKTGNEVSGNTVSEIELSIFQLYQLNVMHMWITDDEYISTKSLKDSQQVIMDGFGLNREARKNPSVLEIGNNRQIVDQFNQVKSFLASTASQATELGLNIAKEKLHFEDVVVFYRNETFQTLLKAKDDTLYILAPILDSDLNWRSFKTVNGTEDEYLSTITNKSNVPALNELSDEEFARQLQMQEDERYAQEVSERGRSSHKASKPLDNNAQYIKKKQKQVKKNMKESKLKKKKKGCVVM